eukprot:PhF_6_TR42917/c0_g1_i2/m.65051
MLFAPLLFMCLSLAPFSVTPNDVVLEYKTLSSSNSNDPNSATTTEELTPQDLSSLLPTDTVLLDQLDIDDIATPEVADKVYGYSSALWERGGVQLSAEDESRLHHLAKELHTEYLRVWDIGQEFSPLADLSFEPSDSPSYINGARSIHSTMSDVFLQWRLLVRSYFVVEEMADGSTRLHRYVRSKPGDAKYHTAAISEVGSETELSMLKRKLDKEIQKHHHEHDPSEEEEEVV